MLAPYVSAKTAAVGSCLALLGGGLVATASAQSTPEPRTLVAAAELGRAPLPAGDADRGAAGLARTALRLAAALDAVPVREGGAEDDRYCPEASLRVQWTAPGPAYAVGAHLEPLGPAPDDRTAAVNGIVVCEGASYAYMGFVAHWSGAAWVVTAVPSLSDEHEQAPAQPDAHGAPAAAAPPAGAPVPAAPTPGAGGLGSAVGGSVDPYARYDPQRTCDPVAKPGTAALSSMLLRTYPASRSLGMSRTCTARGVSEHKEGRAFDWGVNAGVPAQRAAAESALSQLLATDAAGNRHALARRLGVMYLIWDRKIWSAYNATAGWRPYSGASPHTDHVHISLSWDGAMGRTSYWQGANAALLQLDPALRLAYDAGSGGSGGSPGAPAPATAGPAPAGGAGRPDGGTHRKGRTGLVSAPPAEPVETRPGAAEPRPGADREERRQRRQARREAKQRERAARIAAAAAAQEAAELAAEEAAEAAAVQAAALAAAEQARASEQATPPRSGRRSGKGERKAERKAERAAGVAAPAPEAAREPQKRRGSRKQQAAAPAEARGGGGGKGHGGGKGGGKRGGGNKGR